MSTLLMTFLAAWVSASPADPPLQVDDVFLTLIADVAVPTAESGVLLGVSVIAGQHVKRGDRLARVDDSLARLNVTRASTGLARSRREAENDLKVRLARKRHETAVAELRRATATEKRLPNSVSQTEFDRLRLDVDRAELEVAQAKFDVEMAKFSVVAGEEELQMAQMNVRRRQIVAPLDGMIAEVHHRAGEWVEAGQPVVRIVQLDRLRAEGLLSADLATANIKGRSVRLEIRFEDDHTEVFDGMIVFVSPEIHPINGKVQVWAEVVNRDGLLRPGLPADMTIVP